MKRAIDQCAGTGALHPSTAGSACVHSTEGISSFGRNERAFLNPETKFRSAKEVAAIVSLRLSLIGGSLGSAHNINFGSWTILRLSHRSSDQEAWTQA